MLFRSGQAGQHEDAQQACGHGQHEVQISAPTTGELSEDALSATGSRAIMVRTAPGTWTRGRERDQVVIRAPNLDRLACVF